MISTSSIYKNDPYGADEEYFSGTLTLADGSVIQLSSDNIIEKSFSFTEKAVMSNEFQIGGAHIGEIKLGIFMPLDNPFLMTSSSLYLERKYVYGTETVTIPIGHFNPVQDSVSRKKDIVTFTAYDNLVKLDIPIPSNLHGTTKNLIDFAKAVCTHCGLEMITPSGLANMSLSFTLTVPENITYNCRDIIIYIAQLMGCFCRCNRASGKLEFAPFSDTVDYVIDEENSINRSVSDSSVEVTGIQFEETLSGTNGYIIDITGNPFLSSAISNLSTVLTNIRNKVSGIVFYNADITWFGDLTLQAGDCISYQQEGLYGGSRKLIIMSSIYNSRRNCYLYSYGSQTAISGYSPAAKAMVMAEETLKYLKANYIKADVIETEYLKAATADLTYATISSLTAAQAEIDTLKATKADISELTAAKARIGSLEANMVTADYVSANFADIRLSNIENGCITTAMIAVGAVGTAQIADASITDAKILELTANKITTGTLSVERLEIRGSTKSIVYELNNITGALQSQNVDTLNGEILTPRSVTADRIVANAITANEIAAKAITANEIAANTITTAELNTVEIYANSAFVNAVSANSVVVGASKDALEALRKAQSVEERADSGEFKGDKGDTGDQGTQGLNLAPNTEKFFDGQTYYTLGGTGTVSNRQIVEDISVPSKYAVRFDFKKSTSTPQVGVYFNYVSILEGSFSKLTEGETYTVSFWAKVSVASQFYNSSVFSESQTVISGSSTAITTEWQKYYLRFKWTSTTKFTSCFYIRNENIPDNGLTLYLSSYKLEQGEIDDPIWTPAIEDLQGANGVGISSVTVMYYLSTSATALSGGSWSATVPTWADGKYMWTKTVTTYTDGRSSETSPVCITGAKGATGAKGDQGVQGPAGPQGEVGATGTQGINLFRYTKDIPSDKKEYISRTTGTTTYADDEGFTVVTIPATGAYSSLAFYLPDYAFSEIEGKAVTVSAWVRSGGLATYSKGFQITCATFNSGNSRRIYKSIGNFNNSVFNPSEYKDNEWTLLKARYVFPTIAQMTSGSGDDYVKFGVQFYVNDNNTQYPLEIKKVKFEFGSVDDPVWTPAVEDLQGADGKGVNSIVPQYYLSTSNTTQTGGSWSNTCPAWSSGKYIWTRSYITWSDGTTSYTTAVLDNGLNTANSTAASAQSTAQAAQQTANSANAAAANVDKKIAAWCHANDTTLIDGGKIYTGSITADKLNVNSLSAITADLGTVTAGIIKSTNYAETAGTQWDLSTGTFRSSGSDRLYQDTTLIENGKITVQSIGLSVGGSFSAYLTGRGLLFNDIVGITYSTSRLPGLLIEGNNGIRLSAGAPNYSISLDSATSVGGRLTCNEHIYANGCVYTGAGSSAADANGYVGYFAKDAGGSQRTLVGYNQSTGAIGVGVGGFTDANGNAVATAITVGTGNTATINLRTKALTASGIYDNVSSGTVYNVQVNSAGKLTRASSSRRTKTNINYDIDTEAYHKALMSLRSAEFTLIGDTTRRLGMIAEDVEAVSGIAAVYEDEPIYSGDNVVAFRRTGLINNYDDRAIIQMLVLEVQRLNKIIEGA